jgi:flavodoxin
MKSLIILFSYHHNNTEKVANVISKTLGAEIKTPQQVNLNPDSLSEYDLVGFGSGIYFGKIHKVLLDLADKLPQATGKKAFIFSTSGQTGKTAKFHQQLREKLEAKGFTIVDEFNCAGFDTFGALKIMGGIKKGRPNEEDLKAAETFAQNLKQNAF